MDKQDKLKKSACVAALTVLLAVFISGCGKPPDKNLAGEYAGYRHKQDVASLSAGEAANDQPVKGNLGKGNPIGVVNGEGWFKVKRVVDGDTFIIEDNNERVRLIGINAPESVKPQEKPQPYGHTASRFLKKILNGQEVKLVFDVAPRDKYGRLLAYVYLKDGSFVNAVMLKEGYAQVMTVPPNVKFANLFVKLQREAREAGRGLWGKAK